MIIQLYGGLMVKINLLTNLTLLLLEGAAAVFE